MRERRRGRDTKRREETQVGGHFWKSSPPPGRSCCSQDSTGSRAIAYLFKANCDSSHFPVLLGNEQSTSHTPACRHLVLFQGPMSNLLPFDLNTQRGACFPLPGQDLEVSCVVRDSKIHRKLLMGGVPLHKAPHLFPEKTKQKEKNTHKLTVQRGLLFLPPCSHSCHFLGLSVRSQS